jgi:hypothetical protein
MSCLRRTERARWLDMVNQVDCGHKWTGPVTGRTLGCVGAPRFQASAWAQPGAGCAIVQPSGSVGPGNKAPGVTSPGSWLIQ